MTSVQSADDHLPASLLGSRAAIHPTAGVTTWAIGLSLVLGFVTGCGSGSSNSPGTSSTTPALFTETNATSGNTILSYSRAADGSLKSIGSFQTGGNGTGLPSVGLPFPIGGATGAVSLSPNGSFLYAVDAGSDDVAAFTVSASGMLTLIARYPTGGTSPGSIGINAAGTYLYVLNTGSLPNGQNVAGGIAGFSIGSTGALTTLAGSTQPLSAAQYVDPSEVAFSPDGTYLVVTEKATSLIDLYTVSNGVAGPPLASASTGAIPFGFAFTSAGTLVVSNAESTTSLIASTLSSYQPKAGGPLTVITGGVPDFQGAACWVALTSNGAYAYTTNTLSGSISGYSLSSSGSLGLLTTGGVTASQPNTTGPIDDVVAPGNAFLYVLNSMAGKAPGAIAGFAIGSGGALTSVSTGVSGLSPGTIGLAVR